MPTVLRTHLFTNLVGYGDVLRTQSEESAAEVLSTYRRLITRHVPNVRRAAIHEIVADAFHIVFNSPGEAVRTALAISEAGERHNRRNPNLPIRIGMGIDAAEGKRRGRDYVGPAIALAMRLSHVARPGQVLVTKTVQALIQAANVGELLDLGIWGPYGIGQTVHVYEVLPLGQKGADPALRSPIRRLLLAVLFTDIVKSTDLTVELGDREWGNVLERHHSAVRAELEAYQGQEVDTAGDGFFVTFDAPSRAVACALAIRDAVRDASNLEIRAGIHVGECEIVAGKIGGVAVVVGARTREAAQPGEVLVSQTVKDLVIGSEFDFTPRGSRSFKGIPGKWKVFAVSAGD
jgi:class 3 adenylate cyclase